MYLIGNFKNKLTKNEIIDYVYNLDNLVLHTTKVVLAPSIPYLSYFNDIELASQDITSFTDTTITGEVTGEQLKSMNVSYVLVGHSERRIYKGEINIDFINKINNAQANGIKVIYCIGESLKEKENNKTYEVLEKQISEVLNNISVKDIIIAYEPIWAIGSGNIPENNEISEVVEFIKDTIKEKYDTYLPVLYGGSVNTENIKELKTIKNIDGFLVGSASLDPKKLKFMALELED